MRRMIDPQMIIKSQIVNDKYEVDLNEILEKYGFQDEYGNKHVTLQFYSKYAADDNEMMIYDDIGIKGIIMVNTAITISKYSDDEVYIGGSLLSDFNLMTFIPYIYIESGDYENGIILTNPYEFDIYVIKV